MAASESIGRRSIFAALLAAPIITEPQALEKAAALRPGNVWVQLPEAAWRQLLKAAHELRELDVR